LWKFRYDKLIDTTLRKSHHRGALNMLNESMMTTYNATRKNSGLH